MALLGCHNPIEIHRRRRSREARFDSPASSGGRVAVAVVAALPASTTPRPPSPRAPLPPLSHRKQRISAFPPWRPLRKDFASQSSSVEPGAHGVPELSWTRRKTTGRVGGEWRVASRLSDRRRKMRFEGQCPPKCLWFVRHISTENIL